MEQKPTVSRIVHYGLHSGLDQVLTPCAAIVTRVYNTQEGVPVVDLTLFEPGMMPRPLTRIPQSQELEVAHWSWPPRVP